MFSNKNKTLKDSRVRFQHQAFKKQLRQARNYKRENRPSQDETQRKLWTTIGLGPLWARLVCGLVVLIALYAVYVPNPLDIKHLEISGISGPQADIIENLVTQYFTSQKLWPQNNYLTLAPSKLKRYLLSESKNIYQITQIKKKFPATLAISLEPRLETYLITSPEGNFIAANDLFINRLTNATTTDLLGLTQIKILGTLGLEPETYLKNYQQIQAIDQLQKLLPNATADSPDYYQITDFEQPDITVQMKSGWRILFDYKSDLPLTVQKLHLLLSSIDPKDSKRLYYIDMRIKNRGYICLKNTPCASLPASVPVTASTSTATSTLNSASTTTTKN